MRSKVCAWVSLALVCLQVLLIVASWIITAAMPDLPMRSLLSSGGIRWIFGHFASNLNSSVLVDIILLVIAFGKASFSGMNSAIADIVRRKRLRYLDRVAIWVVLIELVISIIVIALLTLVPHAILLSVTGHLYQSSFSMSIVSIIFVVMLICSISFGVISNRLSTLRQAYEAMIYGITRFAWLFPIYIFGMELICSIAYVFAL